ncbi:TIM23 complex component [Spiromyces aspiralis]|uniref:TIM23 complex component n=1 Tax=Spiromyces aspiralis TaxID=68401 RepID=A0ACC1I224_9FUNG|nr:TIM23 complex component [Spiromyces aspiralis]
MPLARNSSKLVHPIYFSLVRNHVVVHGTSVNASRREVSSSVVARHPEDAASESISAAREPGSKASLASNLAAENDEAALASKITWNEFFDIRKRRRMYERLTIVPSTILGLAGGLSYFSSIPIDPTHTFMGLDPIAILGGAITMCGLAGFLLGPTFGSFLWKVTNRRIAKIMAAKEADFFEHIRLNRSNPAYNSMRNPLPDYYGEKVQSISDYRKWLRKQREHERKIGFHIGENQ